MISIEKGITLAIIDDSWKDHLREMDELKQSVQSATYEQKDPLLIYKFESFELFKINPKESSSIQVHTTENLKKWPMRPALKPSKTAP
jgi:preprotein translocase subunit SecA